VQEKCHQREHTTMAVPYISRCSRTNLKSVRGILILAVLAVFAMPTAATRIQPHSLRGLAQIDTAAPINVPIVDPAVPVATSAAAASAPVEPVAAVPGAAAEPIPAPVAEQQIVAAADSIIAPAAEPAAADAATSAVEAMHIRKKSESAVHTHDMM
jgi:hypothetical protein